MVGGADRVAFVSFSSRDQAKAQAICDHLERSGVPCWISSRDVEPGTNYQAAIVRAIQTSKIMVLVFSDHTNQSQEVHKELALASAFKLGVMPVRILDVKPLGALLYELATRQWIDAFGDWNAAMDRLATTARAAMAGTVHVPPPNILDPLAAATQPRESVATPTAAAFSQDQLAAARGALAHHLGPIADVLVKKANAKATSLADLHERLVVHIRDPEAQVAFRRRLAKSESALSKN